MVPDKVQRLLSAYLDGELTDRQVSALKAVLARSAEARSLLEKLQSDATDLRGLARVGVRRDLSASILRAVTPTPRWSERAVPGWLGYPAAAAVLAAVFCGSYFYFSPDGSHRVAQQAEVSSESPVAQAEQPLPAPRAESAEPRRREPPEAKPASPAAAPSAVSQVANAAPPQITGKPAKDIDTVSGKPAPRVEGFEIVDAKTTLSASLRDLDGEPLQEKLLNTLKIGAAFRLELTGSANAKALDAIAKAFRAQGISWLADEFAGQRSRMHSALTDYVVLAEDVTPAEVVDLLRRLGKAERDADPKRLDAARFGDVMLLPLTGDDEKEVARLIGTELLPTQSAAGGGKAAKLALLLSYNPARQLPGTSKEVKRFLEARGERPPGTLRIMLVLRAVTP